MHDPQFLVTGSNRPINLATCDFFVTHQKYTLPADIIPLNSL